MSKTPMTYEALDALDSIAHILKGHENALDRLVAELSKTAKILNEVGGRCEKITEVEERFSAIRTEISNLIDSISALQEAPFYSRGLAVIIGCKKWEDFKNLSTNAEMVSFLIEETEKVVQIDALKKGKVLTFSGESPQDTRLLKLWISEELKIPEKRVVEGALRIE